MAMTFRAVDLFVAAIAAAVAVVMWVNAATLAHLHNSHAYLFGFVNFAVLSTFGESLSNRISSGRWLLDKLPLRAALWGMIGIWIAAVFPFGVGGVSTITSIGMWPSINAAFSTSLWLNILSGYGFFMMMTHFWTNSMLVHGPRWPWEIFGDAAFKPFSKTVLLSLPLFWLPAHTITFLLPETVRITFAAVLGIALGLILTLSANRKTAGNV